MLTPWLGAFPRTVAPLVDEIDSTLGYKLSSMIRDGPNALLSRTAHAQTATMATSVVILRVLEREFGFSVAGRIDVTLGHSLGEFAALVAAGHVDFADSLVMVQRRAEAMAEATRRAALAHGGEYGMVALVSEEEYLPGLIEAVHDFVGPAKSAGGKAESAHDVPPIEQVLIANVNSKNQIVLSGSIERIRTLVAHLRQFLGHDPRAVRLNSDSPFHSPIMKPAVDVMRRLLAGPSRVPERDAVVVWPGIMPCVSNVTARPFGSKAELEDLFARGCLETVRWWDSIRYLDQQVGVRRWLGIGPGKVGRNLVGKEVGMRGRDPVKGGGVWAITEPEEIAGVLRGLDETEEGGCESEGEETE
jgi:[acyl-carrier-protein] S-malonyltransferase